MDSADTELALSARCIQSVLMRSGRDKDQLVFKKWFGLDLAASRWTLDEAHCDFLRLHGLHNVLCVAANQGGMNTGMLSTKLPLQSQESRNLGLLRAAKPLRRTLSCSVGGTQLLRVTSRGDCAQPG
jgi:hypothetical protein